MHILIGGYEAVMDGFSTKAVIICLILTSYGN